MCSQFDIYYCTYNLTIILQMQWQYLINIKLWMQSYDKSISNYKCSHELWNDRINAKLWMQSYAKSILNYKCSPNDRINAKLWMQSNAKSILNYECSPMLNLCIRLIPDEC
jgi:hypothetical protein